MMDHHESDGSDVKWLGMPVSRYQSIQSLRRMRCIGSIDSGRMVRLVKAAFDSRRKASCRSTLAIGPVVIDARALLTKSCSVDFAGIN